MTASDSGKVNVTEDWTNWRLSVFGDPYLVWHEGPDFTVIISSGRSDLDSVTRMLVRGLDVKDPLAAQSFEALIAEDLAPEDSEITLRRVVETATGRFRIRLAEALHTLTADESWSAPIVEELVNASHWSERMEAAIALKVFRPTDELRSALANAVVDPEFHVRCHAANALLIYAGLSVRVNDNRDLFSKITSDARPNDWRLASDALLAAGQSHAQHGPPDHHGRRR